MKHINLLLLLLFMSLTSCISLPPDLPKPPYDEPLTDGQTIKVAPVIAGTQDGIKNGLIIDPPEISDEMKQIEDEAKQHESIVTLLPSSITNSTVSVEKKSDFTKSIAIYDYVDGVIYTVYCSPGHATDLRLEEGEEPVSSPVLGDSSRWELTQGHSIQNGKTIIHLFIRPQTSDVATTLILATNKRTYYFKLLSFETIYMFALKFRYPSYLATETSLESSPLPSVPDGGLNFNFLIEKRQKEYPSWKPSTVYADNKRTFIQLSPYFKDTIQAPALYFIKDYRKENELSVVNYSIKDTLYIVDFALSRGEALMMISGNDKVKITKL